MLEIYCELPCVHSEGGEVLEYFRRLENLPYLDWLIPEVFENFLLSGSKIFPAVEHWCPGADLFPLCLGGEVMKGFFDSDHAI